MTDTRALREDEGKVIKLAYSRWATTFERSGREGADIFEAGWLAARDYYWDEAWAIVGQEIGEAASRKASP